MIRFIFTRRDKTVLGLAVFCFVMFGGLLAYCGGLHVAGALTLKMLGLGVLCAAVVVTSGIAILDTLLSAWLRYFTKMWK